VSAQDPEAAAALDGAPLFFAHSAPDAGVLTRFKRPLEALIGHGATPADGLGLLDLQKSRTGRPDREEQLRVLVAAGSMVAPVHGGNTPQSGWVAVLVDLSYASASADRNGDCHRINGA
jgi:hypothetical protein